MKKLLLILILLSGCSSVQIAWNHPDNPTIYCRNTGCCYPNGSTNICTEAPDGHTVVMYVRITQK